MDAIIEEAYSVNKDKRMLPDELSIIKSWIEKYYRGGNTLEIGAYKGMTSKLILMTRKLMGDENPESKHFVVDAFDMVTDNQWVYEEHTPEMLASNMGDYKSKIEILKATSLSYEGGEFIQRREYDFIFIDGDHRYPVVFLELCLADLYTDHILLHDYGHKEVTMSVDRFCKTRGYKVVKADGRFGLAEIVKK